MIKQFLIRCSKLNELNEIKSVEDKLCKNPLYYGTICSYKFKHKISNQLRKILISDEVQNLEIYNTEPFSGYTYISILSYKENEDVKSYISKRIPCKYTSNKHNTYIYQRAISTQIKKFLNEVSISTDINLNDEHFISIYTVFAIDDNIVKARF